MIVDRERVAKALPGYVLGEQLGSGAFGLVLAGTHRRMGRPVAIKVLEADRSWDAAAGFAVEAQVLAKLDHPHIVRVYDYVEDSGLCMVVMEQLTGGTLTGRRATMGPQEICAVALAVAAALQHAHGHKVLHRDIKADNVMFAGDGTLKVTDFGIAKLFEGSGATASGIAGTPAYMAPEQIEGAQLGPWTDLYALGIVLYSLFTGRLPFNPSLPLLTLLSQQRQMPPPPMVQVPAALAAVVLRLLAKSPADRPPDAATFAAQLASAATSVFGVGWTAHERLPLHLAGAVRLAAEGPAPATGEAVLATPRPTPAEREAEIAALLAEVSQRPVEPSADEPEKLPTAGRPGGPGEGRPGGPGVGPPTTGRRRLTRRVWIAGVVGLVSLVTATVIAVLLRPGAPSGHLPAAGATAAAPSAVALGGPTASPATPPGGSVSPAAAATTPPSGSPSPSAASAVPPNSPGQAAVRPTARSILGIDGGNDTTQVPGSEADTSWVAYVAACSAWLADNGSGALAGVLNTSLAQPCGAELFRSDGMAYTFTASWGARKTTFIPAAGHTMWICVWNAREPAASRVCSPHFAMNGTTPVRK